MKTVSKRLVAAQCRPFRYVASLWSCGKHFSIQQLSQLRYIPTRYRARDDLRNADVQYIFVRWHRLELHFMLWKTMVWKKIEVGSCPAQKETVQVMLSFNRNYLHTFLEASSKLLKEARARKETGDRAPTTINVLHSMP